MRTENRLWDILQSQPVTVRFHRPVDHLGGPNVWCFACLFGTSSTRELPDQIRAEVAQHMAFEKRFHVHRHVNLELCDERASSVVCCFRERRANVVDVDVPKDYC